MKDLRVLLRKPPINMEMTNVGLKLFSVRKESRIFDFSNALCENRNESMSFLTVRVISVGNCIIKKTASEMNH